MGDLTGRSGHSGLVFDKKMWVFGGYDNNTDYYQDVMSAPDTSSLTKGNWDNLTTTLVWTKRNEHISLSFKNKIWVFKFSLSIGIYTVRFDNNKNEIKH